VVQVSTPDTPSPTFRFLVTNHEFYAGDALAIIYNGITYSYSYANEITTDMCGSAFYITQNIAFSSFVDFSTSTPLSISTSANNVLTLKIGWDGSGTLASRRAECNFYFAPVSLAITSYPTTNMYVMALTNISGNFSIVDTTTGLTYLNTLQPITGANFIQTSDLIVSDFYNNGNALNFSNTRTYYLVLNTADGACLATSLINFNSGFTTMSFTATSTTITADFSATLANSGTLIIQNLSNNWIYSYSINSGISNTGTINYGSFLGQNSVSSFTPESGVTYPIRFVDVSLGTNAFASFLYSGSGGSGGSGPTGGGSGSFGGSGPIQPVALTGPSGPSSVSISVVQVDTPDITIAADSGGFTFLATNYSPQAGDTVTLVSGGNTYTASVSSLTQPNTSFYQAYFNQFIFGSTPFTPDSTQKIKYTLTLNINGGSSYTCLFYYGPYSVFPITYPGSTFDVMTFSNDTGVFNIVATSTGTRYSNTTPIWGDANVKTTTLTVSDFSGLTFANNNGYYLVFNATSDGACLGGALLNYFTNSIALTVNSTVSTITVGFSSALTHEGTIVIQDPVINRNYLYPVSIGSTTTGSVSYNSFQDIDNDYFFPTNGRKYAIALSETDLGIDGYSSFTYAGATNPTLGVFTVSAVTYGASPFTLTPPTSESSGSWSYASSNTGVATVSGSTVTVVAVGDTTITATQAAAGDYSSASTTATLTVSSAAPTLGVFTVPAKTFGASPFTLTPPTSESSGSWSYTSSNTGVATVSGSTVTVVAVGDTTITATQAAAGNYSSASTTATLTVSNSVTGPTGGGGVGDPYITTISNQRYKLPILDGPIRFFQGIVDGHILTVNTQLRTMMNEELAADNIRSYLKFKDKMPKDKLKELEYALHKKEKLTFFEKFYIQYKDSEIVLNVWDHKFKIESYKGRLPSEPADGNAYTTKYSNIYKDYESSALRFKIGTSASIVAVVYPGKLVKNGIFIEAPQMEEGNGVLVNVLNASNMSIPSLDSQVAVAKRDFKLKEQNEWFLDHDGYRTRTVRYA